MNVYQRIITLDILYAMFYYFSTVTIALSHATFISPFPVSETRKKWLMTITDDPHLASENMCFCPYSYHYQYCQSVSLLRSVPSYSQRICYLASSRETYSRQRPTLQLPANLQPLSHIQDN